MAITVYGVTGSMDTAHFSIIGADMANAGTAMGVPAGLGATAPTGVRLVTIASGRSVQANTSAVMDAPQTVTIDPQTTTGKTRLDLVCMQVNFSGTTTTAGSLVVVKGAIADEPVRPTLTQNAGVLWQTPLAEVLVRANVSQIAAADVHDIRPPMGGGARNSGNTVLTTDSTGSVYIPHGMGLTPGYFDAHCTNDNVRAWTDYSFNSPTVCKVTCWRHTDNSLVVNTSLRFHWKAEA